MRIILPLIIISCLFNEGMSQTDTLDFKQFSEEYAINGIEKYWLKIYESLDLNPDSLDKQDIFNVVLNFDRNGELELRIIEEVGIYNHKRIIEAFELTRPCLNKNIMNVYTVVKLGVENLSREFDSERFSGCHLIFTYMDPIVRY